ncbi:hypothetical protein LXL04_011301 [Taraxacum kok-saghyz]
MAWAQIRNTSIRFLTFPNHDHELNLKTSKQNNVILDVAVKDLEASDGDICIKGQTIPNMGVYLPDLVVSYDQLYIALSRGISHATTKVLVNPIKTSNYNGIYTSNVVYKEEKKLKVNEGIQLEEKKLKFKLKMMRKQFPGHGQMIPNVSVYLSESVFSHDKRAKLVRHQPRGYEINNEILADVHSCNRNMHEGSTQHLKVLVRFQRKCRQIANDATIKIRNRQPQSHNFNSYSHRSQIANRNYDLNHLLNPAPSTLQSVHVNGNGDEYIEKKRIVKQAERRIRRVTNVLDEVFSFPIEEFVGYLPLKV